MWRPQSGAHSGPGHSCTAAPPTSQSPIMQPTRPSALLLLHTVAEPLHSIQTRHPVATSILTSALCRPRLSKTGYLSECGLRVRLLCDIYRVSSLGLTQACLTHGLQCVQRTGVASSDCLLQLNAHLSHAVLCGRHQRGHPKIPAVQVVHRIGIDFIKFVNYSAYLLEQS